jgi:hypothetical protein
VVKFPLRLSRFVGILWGVAVCGQNELDVGEPLSLGIRSSGIVLLIPQGRRRARGRNFKLAIWVKQSTERRRQRTANGERRTANAERLTDTGPHPSRFTNFEESVKKYHVQANAGRKRGVLA